MRDGNICVPPSNCKDCVCQALNNGQFMSFDGAAIPMNRSCKTYLLSRDRTEESVEHSYEVSKIDIFSMLLILFNIRRLSFLL